MLLDSIDGRALPSRVLAALMPTDRNVNDHPCLRRKQMKKGMTQVLTLALIVFCAFVLTGSSCQQQAEEATDTAGDAAEATGDALEAAADAVEEGAAAAADMAEEGAEAVGEAMDEMGEEMQDGDDEAMDDDSSEDTSQ